MHLVPSSAERALPPAPCAPNATRPSRRSSAFGTIKSRHAPEDDYYAQLETPSSCDSPAFTIKPLLIPLRYPSDLLTRSGSVFVWF